MSNMPRNYMHWDMMSLTREAVKMGMPFTDVAYLRRGEIIVFLRSSLEERLEFLESMNDLIMTHRRANKRKSFPVSLLGKLKKAIRSIL